MKEIWKISELDIGEIHSSEIVSFWLKYFIIRIYDQKGESKSISHKKKLLGVIFGYSRSYPKIISKEFNSDYTTIMRKKSKKTSECDEILKKEPFFLKPYLFARSSQLSLPYTNKEIRAKFLTENKETLTYFGKLTFKILWCRLYRLCEENPTETEYERAKKSLESLYPIFVKDKEPLSQKTYEKWIGKRANKTSEDSKKKKHRLSFHILFLMYAIELPERKKFKVSLKKVLQEEIEIEGEIRKKELNERAIKYHRSIALKMLKD